MNSDSLSLLQANRPLAFFANGIGDALLTLQALRALAGIFEGRLGLICEPKTYDALYHELDLRSVIALTDLTFENGMQFDAERVADQAAGTDVFFSLAPWHSASLEALVNRVSPELSIGFSRFFDVALPKDTITHSADLAFSLPRFIDPNLALEDFSDPPRLPSAARLAAHNFRREFPESARILAVHPDTSSEKCWTPDRFSAVLDGFLSRHAEFFVWIVGLSYAPLDVGSARDRVVSCLGQPLDLALACVAESDLFLGIDSCMLHAADLFRVPGVGIFGPTDCKEWGFRLGPHRHLQAQKSMDEITPETALQALETMSLSTSKDGARSEICQL